MQAAQGQTQRETLKLFRDKPVEKESLSTSLRVRRGEGKLAGVKSRSAPILSAKERYCCDMATD